MPGSGYVLASLLVMGAVTVALRWAPFAFIRVLRGSELVRFLGVTMPVGVMVALVAYTLVDRMGLIGGGDVAFAHGDGIGEDIHSDVGGGLHGFHGSFPFRAGCPLKCM